MTEVEEVGARRRRELDEDEVSSKLLLFLLFLLLFLKADFFLASDSTCVVVGVENWATFNATVRTCNMELPAD